MPSISKYMNISETIGFIFTSIKYDDDDSESIIFTRDNGQKYLMKHEQDCCENVYLADIVGDWDTLLNAPIVWAEKSSRDGVETGDFEGSSTWTFYKFATRKGYVDLRWFGESNGYYSESVDFGEMYENV